MADPFVDSSGEPVLHESYVAFIDELGTSATAASMTDESLRVVVRAAERADRLLRPAFDGGSERVLTFSDHVAIANPGHADLEIDYLALTSMLMTAAMYQLYMTTSAQRAVRGGLTRGALHVGRQRIYGPALVCAVRLEEKEATYPRVLVEREVWSRTVYDLKSVKDPRNGSMTEYLLVDEDCRVFINYLNCLPSEADNWLPDHKKLAEGGMVEHNGNGRVRDKYVWMAVYHNHVIQSRYQQHTQMMIDLTDERSCVARRSMRYLEVQDLQNLN
jgi:hypothetical protein